MAAKLVVRINLGPGNGGASTEPSPTTYARRPVPRRSRAFALGVSGLVGAGAMAAALWSWQKPRRVTKAPPVVASAPAAEPLPPPVVIPTPSAAPVQAVAPPVASSDETACREAIASHRWRIAADPCSAAAAARPASAELALMAALGHHARGRLDIASEWATRAVTLDPAEPDAYVIIGDAAARGGRGDEAARAYRKYLQLAPRGWHARRLRAALAPARPEEAEAAQARSDESPSDEAETKN